MVLQCLCGAHGKAMAESWGTKTNTEIDRIMTNSGSSLRNRQALFGNEHAVDYNSMIPSRTSLNQLFTIQRDTIQVCTNSPCLRC